MNNDVIKYICHGVTANYEAISAVTKRVAKDNRSMKRTLKVLSTFVGFLFMDNILTRQKLKIYDSSITTIESDIRELKKEEV